MKTDESSFEFDNVRVQVLGDHVVRIERRGAHGFEDRETFTVRQRLSATEPGHSCREGENAVVKTRHYRVVLPDDRDGLAGVRVETAEGTTLCELSNAIPAVTDLPSPFALPAVWLMGDRPRVVPPPWGALPPPPGNDSPSSGWDLANDAPDIYVFFPAASGYGAFRRDFLALTGSIPLVPLYALGLWYSRYHPYGEEEALAVIDRFRASGIPLDVFVADTDWRVGASCGYAVNETLFPDLERFVRRAHKRHVRIMLNDHPEPQGPNALDPEELRFRRKGLTSLLEKGIDLWWFDRNWHTHLHAPAPGLEREIWGMRLYHDITRDFAPDRRPLILSNADGIDNGWRRAPAHPAAHCFPVWWTGDTRASWLYLRGGVENSVNGGIHSLTPYVHEDLGGHHDQPDRELYVRFLQFGAFSPVARIHCTRGVHRYPWEYGEDATRMVGDYFRLRYRLMPMLYSAAAEAHRSGLPLLRRCDLEWPEHPEAADSTQYLLGDDLLVAPVLAPAGEGERAGRFIWLPPGEWQDAWSGQIHRGPATIGTTCALHEYPLYIRRGGVVLSAPSRESTGSAVWPDLIADAFVPSGEGGFTRRLYEDDGESTNHERGEWAETLFHLHRAAHAVSLEMAPGAGREGIRPARRSCTLRIHLPPGSIFSEIRLNGVLLNPEEFTLLPPGTDRPVHLFAGAGTRPPPETGPVVEWRGEAEDCERLRLEVRVAAS